MAASSPTLDAHARKNEQIVLRSLASVGQAHVAEHLSVNESTVSRWKDGDIGRFCRMLTLLGLKITPQHYRCYDEPTLQAMLTLARQRMEQLDGVEKLRWEGDDE